MINLGVIDNILGKSKIFREYMLRTSSIGIIPSYRCDRSCSYCKYLSLYKDYPRDMTPEEFGMVLDWFEKSGLNHFKLLGGEPTLYPYFKRILEQTNKRGFVIDRTFSHLLFDSYIADYFDKNIIKEVIVHFQHAYTPKEYDLLLKNIRLLSQKGVNVRLKYNILSTGESYQDLIEVSKKYRIKKVYISLAIPGYSRDTEFASLDNMHELGRDMFKLAKELYLNRIKVFIYPVLPLCMFDDDSRRFLVRNASLKGVCFGRGFISSIRINPDMSIFYCPGIARKAQESLLNYNNLEEIHRHWDSFSRELRQRSLFDNCLKCNYLKNSFCHGGCLIYKIDF